MILMIKSVSAAGFFFRCGRRWTKEGVLADMKEFTESQLEKLRDEPNLRIREASSVEIAAAKANSDDEGSDGEVLSDIVTVISELPADAFKNGSAPTLKAIRAAWGGNPKEVTEALRDQAWAKLTEGGFTPPAAPQG